MSFQTFPKNGNVVGPASATDGHLAVFDGTTGKLIKDGGAVPGGISGLTPNTLPKALTASTIGDSRITDDGLAISLNGLVNVANNAIGIDSQSGATTIGDVGDVGNGTTLTVDDTAQVVTISANTVVNLADGGALNISKVFPTTVAGSQIGAVTFPYTSVYIGNATNNSAQLTGTFTGNRVATFPDASGTVQLVGAANTGCVLTCLSNNTVLSTATGQVFTSPGNDGTPLTVTSEGAVGWVVTRAGTIRNLYIRSGTTAKVNTPATAVVVRKNGADTALTVAAITQTTTTTSSDVAHSFAVVAGDVITVSLTTTGVAGVSVSIASLTFELD